MSKDRTDIKLDIISGIDEKIIDRNTEKRIKLISKVKKSASKIKRVIVIAVAAVLVLILGIGGAFFALNRGAKKEVPVYKGMSASTTSPIQKEETVRLHNIFLLKQGEIFGVRTLDGSDEIPDLNATEEATEEATEAQTDSDLDPSGTVETFYATAGQYFYITVHINNPDNFEIVSFTLNGKKYSSYMFEEGSDMENLVLKCDPKDQKGIVEYTIDAIKYIDGTEIKDVRMDGNRTIRVGLYSEELLANVDVKDEKISYDWVSFSYSLTDPAGLVANNGNKVYARIYAQEKLVGEILLEVDKENTVEFNGLEAETKYKYAVEAEYDTLDGNGIVAHELYSKEVTTQSILTVSDGAKAKDAVNFSFVWNTAAQDNSIIAISIYKGETKVKDVLPNATSVDGLLADNKYTLVVEYSNKGKLYTLSKDIKTDAYVTPRIEFSDFNVEHHKISFDYINTDPDNLAEITSVELWYDGECVKTIQDFSNLSFADLYSGRGYVIKIKYRYDMLDGKGVQNKCIEQTVNTAAYDTPRIYLQNDDYAKDAVQFTLEEDDPYNLGGIESLSLYLGETLISEADDFSIRYFAGLEVNKTYTVKVVYSYDLRNGRGKRTVSKKIDIVTQSSGLQVNGGKVVGLGTCTDTELYINMPIADKAFEKNITIQKLYLGENVSQVGSYSFNECRLITEITMEEGITGIGGMAFRKCDNLLSIDIPNTVTTISDYAFFICDKLESVTPPINCTYGEGVFFGCYAIKRVNIRDLKAWCMNGSYLFQGNEMDFYVNGDLITDLFIPEGVTHIRPGAFSGCGSITSLKMASSVKTIGANAFSDCSKLKLVIVGEGVTQIGDYAFLSNLRFIFIPDNVVEVGSSVVSKSWRICVEASEKPLLWEDDWLYDIGMEDKFGEVVWGVKDLVTDSQGILYGTDANNRKILLYCPEGVTSVVIGNDVQIIGSGAFYECENLKNIEISGSVTEIRELCVIECRSLTSVFIPDSVERVDSYPFWGIDNPVLYIGAASKPSTWEWSAEGNIVWNVKSITVDANGNVTNIVYNS